MKYSKRVNNKEKKLESYRQLPVKHRVNGSFLLAEFSFFSYFDTPGHHISQPVCESRAVGTKILIKLPIFLLFFL